MPEPHDLTATASSHSSERRRAAEATVASDPSGLLARFERLVEASCFSTNVSADKIIAYHQADEVLDTRRFHLARRGGDETAGLAAFAAGQGPWIGRREAFEGLWLHGRQMVYGTVNAGGMGAEGRFGPFCLACDDPEAPAPDALAVFPGDTLERYTTTGGEVDAARARAEATAWSDRAALAVVERGHEALAVPEPGWPAVVCRPDHYHEVTRAGTFPISALSEVRLRRSYRSTLGRLRLRWLMGEKLDNDQLVQARAYDLVRDWRRSVGVELVDV